MLNCPPGLNEKGRTSSITKRSSLKECLEMLCAFTVTLVWPSVVPLAITKLPRDAEPQPLVKAFWLPPPVEVTLVILTSSELVFVRQTIGIKKPVLVPVSRVCLRGRLGSLFTILTIASPDLSGLIVISIVALSEYKPLKSSSGYADPTYRCTEFPLPASPGSAIWAAVPVALPINCQSLPHQSRLQVAPSKRIANSA